LIEQSPFDCIIHKSYGEDWKKQLDEFSAAYPNAAVIDRPESIERLHNRETMLEVVTTVKIPLENDAVIEIPKQVFVDESGICDRGFEISMMMMMMN